jgi:hypothetical protein
MFLGIAAAIFACLGYGVSAVLQAHGARTSATEAEECGAAGQLTAAGGPTLRSTGAAVLTGAFLFGILLDLTGFAGSAVSARLIPLFLCQTIISANLIVTAVLAIFVLGIRLRPRDWAAMALVIGSLFALGLASNKAGGGDSDPMLHWGLLIGSLSILAVGIFVVRQLGSRGAIAAGLIAGLLFGVLAMGVRVLEGLDPFRVGTMLSDPAIYAIAVAGAGGFYLHTVALQLGSVNAATAALVVGETVVPGIVGVTLLGDTARSGLGWLVAVGFVCAVLGAVAVAVFGTAEGDQA